MKTINKNDLIPLLKSSQLADQFDDEITIPKKYLFKKFQKIVTIDYKILIENNNDFQEIMNQLRFYMVKELPFEIYDYILEFKPDLSNFKDFFFEELTFLKNQTVTKLDLYGSSLYQQRLMNVCACKGYLNLIKYCHHNKYAWSPQTCKYAAETPDQSTDFHKNHLACLKYLHENGCSWDEDTCSTAAKNGNLEVLQYARENGCDWNKNTCSCAALGGHLEVLQYARENGCEWDLRTCWYAANYGHLEVLRYAHENGCAWDSSICSIAVNRGNLEVLRYAHENGCSWDLYTCSNAAANGQLDCLKYAIENGCPYCKLTCIFRASQKQHQHIIEYLKSI